MKGVLKKIHRSGNVAWKYRYMYMGERREMPALSEEHAAKKYLEAQILIAAGRDPDPVREVYAGHGTTPTVAMMIDEYLDKLRPTHAKDSTRTFQQMQADKAFCNSEGFAKRLKEFFTGSVLRVNVVSIRAYTKTRLCGAGTMNRELGFFRSAFNYWLRSHPEARKTLPEISWADVKLKHTETPRDRRTSDKEISELSAALAPDWYKPLPAFGVETIMRAAEVCQLEWYDVRGTYILLPAHKTKGKKKARRIPLTSRALAILAAIPRPHQGYVFKDDIGHHVYWGLSEAMKATGMNITFHNLRHEAASRFMERGGDPRSLMEIGGWASLAMVQRYTHPDFERSRTVMEGGAQVARIAEKIENSQAG